MIIDEKSFFDYQRYFPYGSIYLNLLAAVEDGGWTGTIVIPDFARLPQYDLKFPTDNDIIRVLVYFCEHGFLQILEKHQETKTVTYEVDFFKAEDYITSVKNEIAKQKESQKKKPNRPQFSQKQKIEILSKTNCKCAYCGIELYKTKFHVEHLIPLSKGGSNDMENLFPSCGSCNSVKASNTLERFRYVVSCKKAGLTPFLPKIINEYESKGFVLPKPAPVRFYIEELKNITLGEEHYE